MYPHGIKKIICTLTLTPPKVAVYDIDRRVGQASQSPLSPSVSLM
jgi:hypothetical protein